MSIRAVVKRDPVAQRVDVWLLRSYPPRYARRALVGDQVSAPLAWEPYDEGTAPPVLMSLLPEEASALAEELHDYLPPTEATVRHLEDARAVRDRLLAIVERVVAV